MAIVGYQLVYYSVSAIFRLQTLSSHFATNYVMNDMVRGILSSTLVKSFDIVDCLIFFIVDLSNTKSLDYITPILKHLHWWPINVPVNILQYVSLDAHDPQCRLGLQGWYDVTHCHKRDEAWTPVCQPRYVGPAAWNTIHNLNIKTQIVSKFNS